MRSFSHLDRIIGQVPAAVVTALRQVEGRPSSLRTRSEQELAGYRDALDYLFQREWRPLNVGLLLHLHRLLFSYTPAGGGRFKTDGNLVVDRSPDGTMTVRFRPVPAAETEFYRGLHGGALPQC